MAGQGAPGYCLYLPRTRTLILCYQTWLFGGSWRLNSSPHASVTGILLTHHLPSPFSGLLTSVGLRYYSLSTCATKVCPLLISSPGSTPRSSGLTPSLSGLCATVLKFPRITWESLLTSPHMLPLSVLEGQFQPEPSGNSSAGMGVCEINPPCMLTWCKTLLNTALACFVSTASDFWPQHV